MKFGEKLRCEARPEWADKYLNYEALKRKLQDIVAAEEQGKVESLVQARKSIFQGALDEEIQKILSFYKAQSAQLAQQVRSAVQSGQQCLQGVQDEAGQPGRSEGQANSIDESMRAIRDCVGELTQLLKYIALNMAAIRKILKKFAKNVEPMQAVGTGFLTLEIEHPDDPGWRVVQGTFLPASVADELAAMQQHAELSAAVADLRRLYESSQQSRRAVLERASVRLPSQGPRESEIEPALAELADAEEQAARDSAMVHAVPWIEGAAGMFEPPPADEYAFATWSGLALNNLSTLLYMMNYTSLLPPVDELCVHIGVSTSATGTIMAAADMAACISAVIISAWTNHSFKQPLLAGAAASVVGNVLFIASYQRRSLPLLLAGRLMTGLGSARAANRRYTADYVSRAHRTMASALFVASSNLGQALGPFLSLPLAYLPAGFSLAGQPVNSVTAIGYIMALLWAAFLLTTLLLFQDPPAASTPIGLARLSLSRQLSARLSQPLLPHAQREEAQAQKEQRACVATARSDGEGDEERGVLKGSGQRTSTLAGRASMARSGWRATIAATAGCTAALFIQKAVQQAYMDGLPLFSKPLFGWTSRTNAVFLGAAGLGMVPVNVAVGALSHYASDRVLVTASTAGCMAALLLMTTSAHSAVAYFAGGLSLFMATVVLEGCATSLMSKVIWHGFARGTFNAGLLSTEAGSLGRFAGNGMLSVVGRATGVGTRQELARFALWLHGGLAALCGALLLQLALTYSRLAG